MHGYAILDQIIILLEISIKRKRKTIKYIPKLNSTLSFTGIKK